MRPVPRNIDKPNRAPEYWFSFLGAYYGTMFLTHEPLFAMGMAVVAVYLVYKITLNKPEGQSYRLWYRYMNIGKMVPSPRYVRWYSIGGLASISDHIPAYRRKKKNRRSI